MKIGRMRVNQKKKGKNHSAKKKTARAIVS